MRLRRQATVVTLLFFASLITTPGTCGAATARKPQPTMTMTAPALYTKYSYRGRPDLGLAVALYTAGSKDNRFDSARLFRVLTRYKPAAESNRLQRMYGKAKMAAFMQTFTFSMRDLAQLFRYNHVAMPSPRIAPSDGRALALAIYHDGIMPNGKFDCGYMMEHLMTHPVHVALMHDIAQARGHGPSHDANYHIILTRMVLDLKNAYRG